MLAKAESCDYQELEVVKAERPLKNHRWRTDGPSQRFTNELEEGTMWTTFGKNITYQAIYKSMDLEEVEVRRCYQIPS